MRVRYILLLGFVALAGYLLLRPVVKQKISTSTAVLEPFEAPAAGELPDCSLRLEASKAPGHLGTVGSGPAMLRFDGNGDAYTGLADGSIMVQDSGALVWRPITLTMGRPLGLAFGRDGRWLYIADAQRGLLRSDREGHLERLVDTLEGEDLGYVYDVVAAADGMLYLSVPDPMFDPEEMAMAMLLRRAGGMILQYDPETRLLKGFAQGLFLPTDLALSADGLGLLVVETLSSQVLRYDLRNPAVGAVTVVGDLPGLPIAIDVQVDGALLIGLWSGRSAAIDRLGPYPYWREVIAGLPEQFRPWLQASPDPLLRWEANEGLCRVLLEEDTALPVQISSLVRRGDKLLIGSLEGSEIRSYRLAGF